ncbi:MAG: AMP-binding protein, partial [Paludibacteraceae bacterium]|nr:AMP-binding protein [Paludibacteraceae bacterium]
MTKTTYSFHLGTLLDHQAEVYGHRAELFFKNSKKKSWQSISWYRMAKQTNALAGALIEKGLAEGGRVGFFAQNCPEIILGDLAAIKAHATTIPLYATSTLSQAEYIVNNAQISILFVGEQVHYNIALGLLDRCPSLQWIIAIDEDIQTTDNGKTMRYTELLALGDIAPHTEEIEARKTRLSQDDLTSILYTSGTTGDPKGVMLHQWNYTECMRLHNDRLSITNDHDKSLCFLPLTHILERAWCYFYLQRGISIYINKYPNQIQQTIVEVRPTLMCAVPRFWEKVYAAINKKIESFPPLTASLARQCIKIGKQYHEYRRNDMNVPTGLRLRYHLIAKRIFGIVKKAAGINHGKFFPCAGAKLSDEINEFLHALGINICIGYG